MLTLKLHLHDLTFSFAEATVFQTVASVKFDRKNGRFRSHVTRILGTLAKRDRKMWDAPMVRVMRRCVLRCVRRTPSGDLTAPSSLCLRLRLTSIAMHREVRLSSAIDTSIVRRLLFHFLHRKETGPFSVSALSAAIGELEKPVVDQRHHRRRGLHDVRHQQEAPVGGDVEAIV